MPKKPPAHVTLGEKLAFKPPISLFRYAIIALVSLLIGIAFSTLLASQISGLGAGFLSAIFLLLFTRQSGQDQPFLLQFDQQRFMADLKISHKTAIFDGSNIYHFGLDHNIGRLPLGALISALRSDGYRIVCFFDANIYFTMKENGDYPKGKRRHSIHTLRHSFEMEAHEIYVVPSGWQADRFIIETLSHLPVSFAVTNDLFRDYKAMCEGNEAHYDFLNTDIHWRKGVKLSNGELLLFQHKFKFPLQME